MVTGALPFLRRGAEEEGGCWVGGGAGAETGCVWVTFCRLDRRDVEEGCSTAAGGELAGPEPAFLRFLDDEGCAVVAAAGVPGGGPVRIVEVGAAAAAVDAGAAVVVNSEDEGLDWFAA
jgi:hypothetical protein